VPEWHGVVHDSHAEMGCDRLWKTTLYIQWGNLDVIIIVTVPVSVAAAKIPRVLCQWVLGQMDETWWPLVSCSFLHVWFRVPYTFQI